MKKYLEKYFENEKIFRKKENILKSEKYLEKKKIF